MKKSTKNAYYITKDHVDEIQAYITNMLFGTEKETEMFFILDLFDNYLEVLEHD